MVDSRDPEALAKFWCDALGYRIVCQNEHLVDIAPDGASFPGLEFVRVPVSKTSKNRLHTDFWLTRQPGRRARAA